MNIRAQISTVFHLDKCIGCHTCSLACKNLWTDRRGAEYMWWNNVETKPGTGYPTLYEDQDKYRGGWELAGGKARLRLNGRAGELAELFFNPYLPSLDDYYEPFTFRYGDLLAGPKGSGPPTARPVSLITGRPIDIEAGPNWDDDLGGSEIYAANDPNWGGVGGGPEPRAGAGFGSLAFFHLPRICNHCLNPGCLAACPAAAITKRGEDGIVLVGQDKCRAWRMCVSGCPYKKVYFNWDDGKSEKCILCYPLQETGQAPACMHACVGRIRYLGVLLYDADGIEKAAAVPEAELVEAQRELILDPFDAAVADRAARDGVSDGVIEAARRSPVLKFVKTWKMALPLHPEWRTLPMLFYVPPLLPVAAALGEDVYDVGPDSFSSLEAARIPLRFMAGLLAAGDEAAVAAVYRKLILMRTWRRRLTVDGLTGAAGLEGEMAEAGTSVEELGEAYRLTSLAGFEERVVIPPLGREGTLGGHGSPQDRQEGGGFGTRKPPKRGW